MIEPTIVLLIWPVVAICIMAYHGMASGVIWAVVIGYLFLPDSFNVDLPALPPYSKTTALSVGFLLGILLLAKRADEEKPVYTDQMASTVFLVLVVLLVVNPVGTYWTNRSPLVEEFIVRRGLSPRDIFATMSELLFVLVPYYVGRRWVSTPEQHTRLLAVLVIMGLCYSLLAVYEARMSPQLNRTVYGYFPHSWVQHLRGGFRPVIFLRHGLWLGFLLLTVVLACFALSRQRPEQRFFYIMAGIWTLMVLAISRNLGATMLAVMFAPVVLFLSTRMQARIAMIVAVIFLSFPLLRQTDVLTFDGFVNRVEQVAPKRAASLEYRLRNEDTLLDRAAQRPLFGWGGWARSLVYDERGRNTSVQDGTWIIVLGEKGWVGYVGFLGLICFPLLMLGRTARRKKIEPATAGLAMMTSVNLIYVVPNSAISPIGWMTFGALAGFVQFDRKRAGDEEPDPETETARRPVSRYTRFGPSSEPTPSPAVPEVTARQAPSRTVTSYARTSYSNGPLRR